MFHPIKDYKERIRERARNLNVNHLREGEARESRLKIMERTLDEKKESDYFDSSFLLLFLGRPRITVNGTEYKYKRRLIVRKFFYIDEYGPNIEKKELLSNRYKGERDELIENLKQKAVKWPNKADLLLLPSEPFTAVECCSCETPGISLEGLVCVRS